MLGEQRHGDGKLGERGHQGRYEVYGLSSAPRGLRGGLSLDLNHTDPIMSSK